MGSINSHAEEVILGLVVETIYDIYSFLQETGFSIRKTDLERDKAYIAKRCGSEGIQFLVVGLARLGEFYDKVLVGESPTVTGFAPYDGNDPLFLRPIWSHTRYLLVHPHPKMYTFFKQVRTLLHGYKKLETACDPTLATAKFEQFLAIEQELAYFSVVPNRFVSRAQTLLDDYFSDYHPACNHPKHGPGAVAGGERHEQKWNFSTLFESVHKEWPYWDYLFPVRSIVSQTSFRSGTSACLSGSTDDRVASLSSQVKRLQLAACANQYRSLTRVAEPTARMLMVPKDFRGPRIISCEPKELMYLQQGVSKHLVSFITRHPYTHGHVNFDDQTINAKLALASSRSREFATLDLSDASDRVSLDLVRYLFPKRVFDKLSALRSTHTTYHQTKVVLHKFAPMGSALCFPVESIVFWALCVGTIWELCNDLTHARSCVYVYGDDLIIKDEYAAVCMNVLESVALRVNKDKSFMGAIPFRESCGVDALNGEDVTPLRIKKMPPRSPYDTPSLIAWISYAENSQYICPRRSAFILSTVEYLTGALPRVPVPQSFLSFVTDSNIWGHKDYKDLKWSRDRCNYTSRLFGTCEPNRQEELQPWQRLQRNLIEGVLDGVPKVVDRHSTQIRKRRHYVSYLLATSG